MEKLETFKIIEGAILSAVVFVEDNLELQLNSATITLGILPVIQINGTVYRPDGERYRTVLLSLVGKSVSGVFAPDELTTVICFDNGSALIVSRNDDLSDPPEVLVLEKPGEPIVVW